jgi:hypothetical protein
VRKNARFSLLTCAVLLSANAALAQLAETAPPDPPALSAARNIFISNAGADGGLFPAPFSVRADPLSIPRSLQINARLLLA